MNDIEKWMRNIRIEGTSVLQKPDELTIIGKGRSAVVFKLPGVKRVLKVFYPDFVHLARLEASIYQELANRDYYPSFYEGGEGYVVLEYLEGRTFYECLVQGIVITEEMIAKVDHALNYARKKGLNPSDTHLQNVMLLTNGDVRVIDVVRFRQNKICTHWEDLKIAYDSLYSSRYFPKKYPVWFVEMIIRLYRKGFIRLKKRK